MNKTDVLSWEQTHIFRYTVNTFQNDKPVQVSGEIEAYSDWDAVSRLIESGIVDSNGYEFLELDMEA